MALESFAQRAGPSLRVAGALAGAHGAQVTPQLAKRPGNPSAVASRNVHVKDAVPVRGGPLKLGHGAGNRADVLAVTGQRFLRRNHAVAPVSRVRLFVASQNR